MRETVAPSLALAALIQLTTPTGHPLDINPAEISSTREPIDVSGHWARGVRCVVFMTNGRFNAVAESCAAVRLKLNPETGQAPCVWVCGGTGSQVPSR